MAQRLRCPGCANCHPRPERPVCNGHGTFQSYSDKAMCLVPSTSERCEGCTACTPGQFAHKAPQMVICDGSGFFEEQLPPGVRPGEYY